MYLVDVPTIGAGAGSRPTSATSHEPLILSRTVCVMVDPATRTRGRTPAWMFEAAKRSGVAGLPLIGPLRAPMSRCDTWLLGLRGWPRIAGDREKKEMFCYRAQLRFSDEDANNHINQAAYARMFDDAVSHVRNAAEKEAEWVNDRTSRERKGKERIVLVIVFVFIYSVK